MGGQTAKSAVLALYVLVEASQKLTDWERDALFMWLGELRYAREPVDTVSIAALIEELLVGGLGDK